MFPHEKQRSLRQGQTSFPYDPYIRQIWNHATRLLATTKEVTVIGYSFSAIDSRHMVSELLNKAAQCQKLVIQNPDVPAVKAELQSYELLRGRIEIEFVPTRFGDGS
jgi:hypothetical protein